MNCHSLIADIYGEEITSTNIVELRYQMPVKFYVNNVQKEHLDPWACWHLEWMDHNTVQTCIAVRLIDTSYMNTGPTLIPKSFIFAFTLLSKHLLIWVYTHFIHLRCT